jgi:hypothetical protein
VSSSTVLQWVGCLQARELGRALLSALDSTWLHLHQLGRARPCDLWCGVRQRHKIKDCEVLWQGEHRPSRLLDLDDHHAERTRNCFRRCAVVSGAKRDTDLVTLL